MRLVFFVNNSVKDFSTPTFIPEDGDKGFLLSRFVFAVLLQNYCAMKKVGNGIYSVHQFIKTNDFKNYALSFLTDNFLFSADLGDSFGLVESASKFHSFKADFDIASCSTILSSSELNLFIEEFYEIGNQAILADKNRKGGKKNE